MANYTLAPRPPSRSVDAKNRISLATCLTTVEDLFHHELERFFVIKKGACIKETAGRMGWSYDSLVRCVRGAQPFPAGRLPSLVEATQHLSFLECLVRAIGKRIVDTPGINAVPEARPPLEVLAELQVILGRVAETVRRMEGDKSRGNDDLPVLLDPDNLEELNKALDQAHTLLEVIRAAINAEAEKRGKSE